MIKIRKDMERFKNAKSDQEMNMLLEDFMNEAKSEFKIRVD